MSSLCAKKRCIHSEESTFFTTPIIDRHVIARNFIPNTLSNTRGLSHFHFPGTMKRLFKFLQPLKRASTCTNMTEATEDKTLNMHRHRIGRELHNTSPEIGDTRHIKVFVPSKMITHKIGVLGEVDRLQGQAPEPLASINGFILRRGSASAPWLATPFSVHRIALTLSGPVSQLSPMPLRRCHSYH